MYAGRSRTVCFPTLRLLGFRFDSYTTTPCFHLHAMSLPRSDYDPRRVCLNPFPFLDKINLGKHRRTFGVYLAGGLVSPPPHPYPSPSFLTVTQFSLGIWTFLDAAILSAHAHPPLNEPNYPVPVHVTFADWVPGLCSLLGILVVNLIDKDRVRGDEGFGDSRAVWRARLFLFVGFALMAGGLAGSVVCPPPSIVI